MHRRRFLTLAGVGIATAALPRIALADIAGAPTEATAIVEVFGDGLRLTGVALEYPAPVDGRTLALADYAVENRRVTGIAAATAPDPAAAAPEGRFVLVMLDPEDAAARLYAAEGRSIRRDPPQATITAAGGTVATTAAHRLLVDEFEPRSIADAATGITLKYNLFVPRDYDPARSYPLVLFMHDASVTSDIQDQTLVQGLGAVVWTRPEEQAVRPCFVLAPQFDVAVVDDRYEATPHGEVVVRLIEALAQEFSLDFNRLYTTGQSGGGMLSIALDIAHPDLFAASLLVACQWDPALVDPMANDRLFIIVAEEDQKAFPGQNAIAARLEALGSKVNRAVWNGRWSADQFASAWTVLRSEGASVNYVTLAAGTVIPEGASTEGAAAHMATWPIAYTIAGPREWLFAQKKT
jgi:predicted peptidase